MKELRPHPGAQEAFLSSTADIAIGGGSAGGGKSFLMCLEAGRHTARDGYNGIVFRRKSTELVGGGSLWDEAHSIYPHLGGVPRESPSYEYRFRGSRSRIEFSHLQHDKDVQSHQSKQYTFVGFDEMCHFTSRQFWGLIGRLRSKCGVKPYFRGTCNPDPDSFVLTELISWWIDDNGDPIPERSGKLRWFVRMGDELHWADSAEELHERFPLLGERDLRPMSLTFIPFSLDDNPTMDQEDPDYRAKLLALPYVERMRLLGGNWKIRPAAGLYFRRDFFDVLDALPPDVSELCRGWDLAATKPTPQSPDPDWTCGVLLGKRKARRTVCDMKSLRDSPGAVRALLKRTAVQDQAKADALAIPYVIALYQDPGQAGKDQIHSLRQVLDGFRIKTFTTVKDKVTNAGPWSSKAEGGLCDIVRGDWNDFFLNTHEAFPDGGHDDPVDAAVAADRVLTRKVDIASLAAGGMTVGRKREAV